MSLSLRPISIREANAAVARWHRHNDPVVGCKFPLAVAMDGKLVGVAFVGRPSARALDDGYAAEITRVATDGTKNACSKLYAAARNAAKAMGYRRVYTYTLASESGASLRAAGFVKDGDCPPVPVGRARAGRGYSRISLATRGGRPRRRSAGCGTAMDRAEAHATKTATGTYGESGRGPM